jgi:hypothetical protein
MIENRRILAILASKPSARSVKRNKTRLRSSRDGKGSRASSRRADIGSSATITLNPKQSSALSLSLSLSLSLEGSSNAGFPEDDSRRLFHRLRIPSRRAEADIVVPRVLNYASASRKNYRQSLSVPLDGPSNQKTLPFPARARFFDVFLSADYADRACATRIFPLAAIPRPFRGNLFGIRMSAGRIANENNRRSLYQISRRIECARLKQTDFN